MPKPHSDKFVLGLNHADGDKLGIKLAKLCIRTNLPSSYVADGLEVSRMTVHRWFRGGSITRHMHSRKIKQLMELVEQSLADGRLPATNLSDAKLYIDSEVRPAL